jgi:hypothetical protein
VNTIAESNGGEFTASLAPRTAAVADKGISITVSSGVDSVTIDDVLFGDVWVCSGEFVRLASLTSSTHRP